MSQYKAFKALTMGGLTEGSQSGFRGVCGPSVQPWATQRSERRRGSGSRVGGNPRVSQGVLQPEEGPPQGQAEESGLLCRVLQLVKEDGTIAHSPGLAMRSRRPKQERSG